MRTSQQSSPECVRWTGCYQNMYTCQNIITLDKALSMVSMHVRHRYGKSERSEARWNRCNSKHGSQATHYGMPDSSHSTARPRQWWQSAPCEDSSLPKPSPWHGHAHGSLTMEPNTALLQHQFRLIETGCVTKIKGFSAIPNSIWLDSSQN